MSLVGFGKTTKRTPSPIFFILYTDHEVTLNKFWDVLWSPSSPQTIVLKQLHNQQIRTVFWSASGIFLQLISSPTTLNKLFCQFNFIFSLPLFLCLPSPFHASIPSNLILYFFSTFFCTSVSPHFHSSFSLTQSISTVEQGGEEEEKKKLGPLNANVGGEIGNVII